MAIRTSDGIYLEVLASAPVAGVPIEIDVYGGNNIATMLATLEGAQAPAFTDPFGDIGSGHFRIPVTDPKATGSIIRSGNYVKVKIAGVYRYAFFLENPRKVVASTDGEAGEYWDLGGRGNIAYLERGSVYPPGWPTPAGTTHEYVGVTAAFIFDELLAAAQARGAIPQLTWDFSATRDSDNAPWTDTLTMSVPSGMSLLDLWRQFVGMGYESEMTPDLRLRLWKDRSRDFTETVIFRAGKHIRGEVTRDPQDAGLRTRILVQGDGGRFFEVTDPTLEGDPYIGRREGYLSFTASTDPTTLQRVGDNALAEVSLASDALSVPLHHGIGSGDYEPYADYRNGDWVSLDIPGTYTLAKVRVRSLSVKAIVGGDYEVDADFNSVSLENIVRLKRIVDALGGGGSASGVVGSTGGSLSSSGGASSGSTGRVGAEQGDTPGYLYDKLEVGPMITKTLGGVGRDRTVALDLNLSAVKLDDLSDVNAPTPGAGQLLQFDGTSWVPGVQGSGPADRIWTPQSGSNPYGLSDEFNDGAIAAAWTGLNAAGKAGHIAWTEGADVLSFIHNGNDAGSESHAMMRSLLGRSYPLTVEIAARWLTPYAYSYLMIGPMFADGAVHGSGKQIWQMNYTNSGVATAANFSTRTFTGYNAQVTDWGDVNYQWMGPTLHMRLRWTAANTFVSEYSPDGVSWWTHLGPNTYTITPSHIGIAVSTWAQPSGVATVLGTIEYFRVY